MGKPWIPGGPWGWASQEATDKPVKTHRLARGRGHDCEQTPGNAEGQGSLVHKESDMTEQVNNIKG